MKAYLFTEELAKRIAAEPKESGSFSRLLAIAGEEGLVSDTAIFVLCESLKAYQGLIGTDLFCHLPSPDKLYEIYSSCLFVEDDSENYFPKMLRLFAMKLDFSSKETIDYFEKLVYYFAFEERKLISDSGIVYQFISNPTASGDSIDKLISSMKSYYGDVPVDQLVDLAFDYSYKTPELLTKLKQTSAFSNSVNAFLSSDAPSSKKLQNPFLSIHKRIDENRKLNEDFFGAGTSLSRLTSSYLSKHDMDKYLEHVGEQFGGNIKVYGDAVKSLLSNCNIPNECSELIFNAPVYINVSEKNRVEFLVDLIDESIDCVMECPMFIVEEALGILVKCTQQRNEIPASMVRDEYTPLVERTLAATDMLACNWKEYPEGSLIKNYSLLSSFVGDESIYHSFIDNICFLNKEGPISTPGIDSEIDSSVISKYAARYGMSKEFIEINSQDERLCLFAMGVMLLSDLPYAYITDDRKELDSVVNNIIKLLPHLKKTILSYAEELNLYRPLQFMFKDIHQRHGDNIVVNNVNHSLSGILDSLTCHLNHDSNYVRIHQDYISFLLKQSVDSAADVKLKLGSRPAL